MWTVGIWTSTFEKVFEESLAYTSIVGSGLNAVNYVAGNNKYSFLISNQTEGSVFWYVYITWRKGLKIVNEMYN